MSKWHGFAISWVRTAQKFKTGWRFKKVKTGIVNCFVRAAFFLIPSRATLFEKSLKRFSLFSPALFMHKTLTY